MRRILLLLSFSIGFVASAADRIFPLPLKTEIVSDYGVRSDPFLGRPAMHTGLDLRAATGDIVSASQSGYVTVAGWDRRGYGQLIEICDGKDGKGWCTRYGHNNSVSVKVGDKVSVGQAIAEVGSSGRSMGPHAHFEILKDGKQIDPAEHVEGLKFELGDIEKISAENREILGKFSEARCESSELSSHDQDDEEKMEGSRRARDEKQKSLEKDMTGLKALKIQSRAGWYMT
ncbi:MAG: M23 family metallopeptidase, partial [Pseudobdellovibrionaceae bacterium]